MILKYRIRGSVIMNDFQLIIVGVPISFQKLENIHIDFMTFFELSTT